MTEENALQRALRLKREKAAASAGVGTFDHTYDDLIPDTDSSYGRTEEDMTIDRLVDRIGILEAYERWIPKPIPARFNRSRNEGEHVRCPRPEHPDNNPSAWINQEKKTWVCPVCGGGDVLDLAAIRFSAGSDYKSGKNFPDLKRKIAEDYGYRLVTAPGLDKPVLVPPAVEPTPRPAAVPAPVAEAVPAADPQSSGSRPALSLVPESTESNVVPITGDDDVTLEDIFGGVENLPVLDWRSLVVSDTFIDHYMRATIVDDVPEEYHFWNALLAVSMAIGRDVTLWDTKPVLGNLFICILGRTGSGKSRANAYNAMLAHAGLPFEQNDYLSRGAKPITPSGSAEALIRQFSRPIPAPTGKGYIGHAPTRGIIEYNEMSSLMGKAARAGNVTKPVLMSFFDGDRSIGSTSLTNGEVMAVDAFACVLTSAQPKALQNLLTQEDADSGFINRWIFVTGKQKKRVAVGGARVDISPAVPYIKKIHDWAYDQSSGQAELTWMMPWGAAALERFTQFFDNVLEPVRSKDETGLLTRIDLICKKLILLLSANEMLDEVTVDVVERVIKMYEYLISVFQIPGEHIGSHASSRVESIVIELISRSVGNRSKTISGATLKDIVAQATKDKNITRKMVTDALETLSKTKEIDLSVQPPAKPGGPDVVLYRMASHG